MFKLNFFTLTAKKMDISVTFRQLHRTFRLVNWAHVEMGLIFNFTLSNKTLNIRWTMTSFLHKIGPAKYG